VAASGLSQLACKGYNPLFLKEHFMSDSGYVNYFEILGLPDTCKPGDVRKEYKRHIKDLLLDIQQRTMNEATRDRYLLSMALLNASFYILRDNDRRENYVRDRGAVIKLEAEWREAVEHNAATADSLRRQFDVSLRHFLATYLEELVFEAGRDTEAVEASGWDPNHERHASRVLRHHRQRLYQEIHERLPFTEVTKPEINWDERGQTVARLLSEV